MKKLIFLIILLFAIPVVAQDTIILREGGIPDATETLKGKTELATDAETVTGTATDKVTTPANITAKMAAPGAIGGTTPAAGTFTNLKGYTSVVNISSNTTLTTAQCNGTIIYMTGNITATMPAVTIGLDTTFYSTDATVKYVDMNASDRLRLNGTAMDDGDKATSPGNAGNAIRIHGDSAAGYTEIGMIGGWVDGG